MIRAGASLELFPPLSCLYLREQDPGQSLGLMLRPCIAECPEALHGVRGGVL